MSNIRRSWRRCFLPVILLQNIVCFAASMSPRDTLPPHLLQQNRTTKQPGNTPVPEEIRGPELTFKETGQHKVFMMAKNNAFIQLDGNQTANFQLRLCREISFKFRTGLPHGLLVYHSIKDRPEGLNPYALYVIVEKGQLKVVHVFGKHSTSIIVGEGLNRDHWHRVKVTIDVKGQRLKAAVNDRSNETKIEGLHKQRNYGVNTDLISVVLIGGWYRFESRRKTAWCEIYH